MALAPCVYASGMPAHTVAQALLGQHAELRRAVSQLGAQTVSSLLTVSSNALGTMEGVVPSAREDPCPEVKRLPCSTWNLWGSLGPALWDRYLILCFDSAHSLCISSTLVLFQFYGTGVRPVLY